MDMLCFILWSNVVNPFAIKTLRDMPVVHVQGVCIYHGIAKLYQWSTVLSVIDT